jgi:hypothetical protein
VRRTVIALLLAAAVAGTLSDRAHPTPPLRIGGYRVLAADFHVHNFPLSASTLAPWDLVLEARRQGLDAIAITPHNQVLGGRLGRWFARKIGGPIVLAGEEIHSAKYHLIAVGIHDTIGWRRNAVEAVDEVHRQGGVAIAAHPAEDVWAEYAPAMDKLDGSEVFQPSIYMSRWARSQYREFNSRAPLAAIGSSDFHGPGPLGLCRTYVFVKEVSESGILEAIRAHRTAACGAGIPGCELPQPEPPSPAERFGALVSRLCAIPAMLGLALGLVSRYAR